MPASREPNPSVEEQDEEVDLAVEESFPASDPPSWTSSRASTRDQSRRGH